MVKPLKAAGCVLTGTYVAEMWRSYEALISEWAHIHTR